MRNRRKISLIITLLFLSVFALSACTGKNKTQTNLESKTSAASKSKKSSDSPKSKESASSTAESSSQETKLSWDKLTVAQKNQLYAAWLQNSQGIFVIYTAYPTTYQGQQQNGTVFINQGSNGSHNSDGNNYAGVSIQEQINSALFIESNGTVTMLAPNGENAGGYSGNWSDMKWSVKESLSTQELINRYSAQMETAGKQIKTTNAGSPGQ